MVIKVSFTHKWRFKNELNVFLNLRNIFGLEYSISYNTLRNIHIILINNLFLQSALFFLINKLLLNITLKGIKRNPLLVNVKVSASLIQRRKL